jgi:hypothetical protein
LGDLDGHWFEQFDDVCAHLGEADEEVSLGGFDDINGLWSVEFGEFDVGDTLDAFNERLLLLGEEGDADLKNS